MPRTNIFLLKSLTIFIIAIQIVLFFSSSSQFMFFTTTPAQGWSNCTAVSGNTDQTITNDYVKTSSDPAPSQSLVNQYPNADKTYLDAFQQALIGMTLDQSKSFVISASQNPYPNNQQYAQVYGKDLYYDVKITAINYPSGTTTVAVGTIVNVLYSLWVDCPTQGSSTVTQSNTGTNTISTSNNIPLYVGGGVVLVGILATIGYTVIRKSNTSSSETIQKSQAIKEQKNLNQIKDLLEQKKENPSNQDTVKTDDKHMPNSRPRRR